jgi:hypothetical protein
MRMLLRSTIAATLTMAGFVAVAMPAGADTTTASQPVPISVTVSNGQVCVGISEELPVCVPGPIPGN